ncbi:hypothetical protein M9H77_27382 [Catharanthus roseus]|uniref:Uncharacterized protein n=1 Tax=Catharanthus roseus TaxID=4058 RepID=A0ACC0AEH3_CATRO|nr:hypothetical protein M9H77_27382 [Catharanthus roseus]
MLASKCIILVLFSISVLYIHFGNAQINPVQIATNAFLCFNNKLIYNGCDEEYRLNQSGDLRVPCEAASNFCYGPCLSETRTLLKCIDKMASGFVFLNQATTRIIRNVLDSGCSYTPHRGLFNLENDLPSGNCNFISRASEIGSKYTIVLISICSLLILLHF